MSAGTRSDRELARLAQDGDVDAFAEIVRRYEPRLRLVLVRVLDDARDVEEAVQDAFVRAWQHLGRYRGDAALFTWLYRIGMNAALAQTRRKSPPTVDVTAIDQTARAPHAERPDIALEQGDLRGGVLRALGALPYEYREAVVLRDVAGLSNAEVAAALGVGLAAAKSRIHRGRLRLRELLEPLLDEAAQTD